MNEVYVHFLSGGPCDGDHIPNHRPWETLTVTKFCKNHQNRFELDDSCPDCKNYQYTKIEPNEYKEADCPGLEVITKDGVNQSPIIHRVDMVYKP